MGLYYDHTTDANALSLWGTTEANLLLFNKDLPNGYVLGTGGQKHVPKKCIVLLHSFAIRNRSRENVESSSLSSSHLPNSLQ